MRSTLRTIWFVGGANANATELISELHSSVSSSLFPLDFSMVFDTPGAGINYDSGIKDQAAQNSKSVRHAIPFISWFLLVLILHLVHVLFILVVISSNYSGNICYSPSPRIVLITSELTSHNGTTWLQTLTLIGESETLKTFSCTNRARVLPCWFHVVGIFTGLLLGVHTCSIRNWLLRNVMPSIMWSMQLQQTGEIVAWPHCLKLIVACIVQLLCSCFLVFLWIRCRWLELVCSLSWWESEIGRCPTRKTMVQCDLNSWLLSKLYCCTIDCILTCIIGSWPSWIFVLWSWIHPIPKQVTFQFEKEHDHVWENYGTCLYTDSCDWHPICWTCNMIWKLHCAWGVVATMPTTHQCKQSCQVPRDLRICVHFTSHSVQDMIMACMAP